MVRVGSRREDLKLSKSGRLLPPIPEILSVYELVSRPSFRETFVARLLQLQVHRSLGRAAWQRQIHIELRPILLAGIALGLGLGSIEQRSNLPLAKSRQLGVVTSAWLLRAARFRFS